ncbi:MAG: YdeI/OmpD-associated family protein [Bacteroidetes bacterium]|nr:YdeI/OmpD-associated family protein [Bacteroidota bacterium]
MKDPETHLGYPAFHFRSAGELRKWLENNHAKSNAVFVVMYRKESEVKSVHWDELVNEVICFGWIDGKRTRRNHESFYQYISPRNPKSHWSKINKAKVERLLSENKIAPAGLAMIELAKKTGTWNALDKVDALELPDDLLNALKKNKKANEYFHAFPPSAKKLILWWIMNAKRPETRQKRIDETVTLAEKNVRANQYQAKGKI